MKFEVEYGDESKLLAHLDSSENQNPEARIKTIIYLWWNLTAKISRVWLRPCWKKLSLKLHSNKKLNIDISEKKPSIFWEWPDFDAKNQLTEILIESFPLSVGLLIVTPMKEIKPGSYAETLIR